MHASDCSGNHCGSTVRRHEFSSAFSGSAAPVFFHSTRRFRDVAEIRERSFPVYARGVNHRGPYKDGPGEINVPVTVGGMVVRPGDIVVGDQDGLCAFSPDLAETVIAKALEQFAKEEATMMAIREGKWDRSHLDALEARCLN